MSWFDTAGLSFAKSAFQEVQKRIDKALDIKDDVEADGSYKNVAKGNEDIGQAGEVITKIKVNKELSRIENDVNEWGSFTGSYEVMKPIQSDENGMITSQPAPLATPETELTPIDTVTGFPSKFTSISDLISQQNINEEHEERSKIHHIGQPEDKLEKNDSIIQNRRSSVNSSNLQTNRLSILSNESEERKSSESLEVLTTPDSELKSISTSSSIGLALTSPSGTDSVEVIDSYSLNSPSSVEVIPDSNEFQCDGNSDVTSPGYSTDSVEVIEENENEEELSVADSYTSMSMSESTGTTMISNVYRITDSCQDLSQASSKLRSGASTPDVLRLSLPSHGSCDLLSESIQEGDWESPEICQPEQSKSIHGSPVRRLLSRSEERINGKLEICRDRLTRSDATPSLSSMLTGTSGGMEDSTQSDSDRTVVDSSCEGTFLGSESEDGTTTGKHQRNQMDGPLVGESTEETKSDIIKTEGSSSSSMYMKEMLAEAIGEDSFTRETSPTLSEKSRSDVVKVDSQQTSGHTSGDELETTTSSDIEIISRYSSPNGDSSSTTSRHSPAKLHPHGSRNKLSLVTVDLLGKATHGKARGHQREPSEASSGCSEDISSEVEKLSKKIMELTEILEAREEKLLDLSKLNSELHEKNVSLKKQLETVSKSSEGDNEKDEVIKQLSEEGQKLSKHQLKLQTFIKALRKQEKEQQLIIANDKKQIEYLSSELEKLKKKLAAKEELERSQIEKIGLMMCKVSRQDEETATLLDQLEQAVIKAEQLKTHLDSTQQQLESTKKSLDIAERDLRNTKNAADAGKRDSDRLRDQDREMDALRTQLEELRSLNEQRETQSREEKKNLMRRLEEAESRNEELAQSVSAATRPLLRQLDQLQASCNQQRENWEQRERQLLERLDEALAQQKTVRETDKVAKQEVANLRGRLTSLETQLQKANEETTQSKLLQAGLETQLSNLNHQLTRLSAVHKEELNELRGQVADARRDLALAEAAANEKAQQQRETEKAREVERVSPIHSSPTLSFGHMSMSGSESWPQFADDAFETSSVAGRNLYDSVRSGSSTLLEGLQAQLKMREGETHQLQWEMQRRDAERSALTSELTALSAQLAEREHALDHAKQLQTDLATLKRNYDALLQMHGEKVEEVEELRLDLQDVKDMYKAQIDQLIQSNLKEGEPPG